MRRIFWKETSGRFLFRLFLSDGFGDVSISLETSMQTRSQQVVARSEGSKKKDRRINSMLLLVDPSSDFVPKNVQVSRLVRTWASWCSHLQRHLSNDVLRGVSSDRCGHVLFQCSYRGRRCFVRATDVDTIPISMDGIRDALSTTYHALEIRRTVLFQKSFQSGQFLVLFFFENVRTHQKRGLVSTGSKKNARFRRMSRQSITSSVGHAHTQKEKHQRERETSCLSSTFANAPLRVPLRNRADRPLETGSFRSDPKVPSRRNRVQRLCSSRHCQRPAFLFSLSETRV